MKGEARAAMRAACVERAPTCDPVALLGGLERASLRRALVARGLVVEPAPTGKRIGQVLVTTLPVFGDETPFLRWANLFHWRSKAQVIKRELVLGPGDRWDADQIDESIRHLRDPLNTSVAVIVAVRAASGAADEVDLLVVTRDVWSLRTNYNGELQDGTFTFLTISLSENNFFGSRTLAALAFRMDQATFSLGPVFIDKNAFGRHLDVRAAGGPLWNRQSYELEGSESTVTVSRPLWSLATTWGVYGEWSHKNSIVRRYRGNVLRTYDAPSTPDDDALPWRYRDRQWSASVQVVRSRGARWKQRPKLGYELASQRPSVLADFAGDAAARADFEAEVMPRSERSGRLFAGYELFTASYRDYRDVDSFDVAESVRIGPRVQLVLGVAPRWLGSDRAFGTVAFEEGVTVPLGDDGLLTTAGGVGARLEDGALIDRSVTQSLRLVTPRVAWLRLVSEAKATGFFREQANRRIFVGGDAGLRGFPVGAFVGRRALVWQSELRTGSVRMPFGLRWGFVAFYELAGAGNTVRTVDLHHDVGVGLRSLTPQLSAEPFRIDLAMPLDGIDRYRPRLIVGYRQAF
ncbi:MAG: hypothetical protein IPH44_18590 [Myxococcales bacterium]|nr:hypothetical protein [Myxococcales bacterium]MBP6842653.1 hypothetical protein [Kofleriaceae bacterium]